MVNLAASFWKSVSFGVAVGEGVSTSVGAGWLSADSGTLARLPISRPWNLRLAVAKLCRSLASGARGLPRGRHRNRTDNVLVL